MSIIKIHWQFKERFNRASSNYYMDFTPMQIDQFVNDGLFQFMEREFPTENSQRIYDALGNLIVTSPEQGVIEPVTSADNKYEFDFADLEYDYYHYKRAVCKLDGCHDIRVDIEGQGRINDLMNDEMQKPSLKWKRLIGYIAKSSTNDGRSLYVLAHPDMTITGLALDYVRKPKPVFFGGYNTLDYLDCQASGGTNCPGYSMTSPSQDLEIHTDYHTLIVDYAVREALRTLGMTGEMSLVTDKLSSPV